MHYFNTDDGGSNTKSNSLEDPEAMDQGLETIGFLAKGTIGFRETEVPPSNEVQTKRIACHRSEKCKRTLAKARRRNSIFSAKKNGKNEWPPISNLDPGGNTWSDSRPDPPSRSGVTVVTPYMVMAGGTAIVRPLFYVTPTLLPENLHRGILVYREKFF